MAIDIGNLRVYTVEELAEKLGVQAHTIYYYVKTGRLRARRFGKKFLIPHESLEEYFGVQHDKS